jgi:uncharacterized delta-60 repeat protein
MILAGVGPRDNSSAHRGPAMLTRLLPNGAIDASFGTDGAVTAQPFPGGAAFIHTVELPGGDLLASGYAEKTEEPDRGLYAFLARFTADGELVTTWGDHGMVAFTQQIDGYTGSFLYASAQDVLVSPDGGLLVFDNGTVWRMDTNGVRDESFGTDGQRRVPRVDPVALPDGRFVMAERGYTSDDGFQIGVQRYLADATVDPSFDHLRFGTPHADDGAAAGAMDAEGDVLIGGSTTGHGSGRDFLLARILPDATLDTTVGIDGLIATDVDGNFDVLTSVAPLPDGRVAVMGITYGAGATDRREVLAVYGAHDLDDESPEATISRPAPGTQYGQLGVQAIRGISRDRLSGVTGTEAALRMHRPDGSCAWMGDGGWVDRACRRPLWHDAGPHSQWAWDLPRLLPRSIGSRGRWYTAYARATDSGGNVERRFERDRNRVRFEIGIG